MFISRFTSVSFPIFTFKIFLGKSKKHCKSKIGQSIKLFIQKIETNINNFVYSSSRTKIYSWDQTIA